MEIELIPVIELGYENKDIPIPDLYPYWENPELWNKFHNQCYAKAGFIEKFNPYLPGSSFVKLSDISDNNLIKIIKDHTQGFTNEQYEVQEVSALNGGYILRIDDEDKFFPQCCGELSDIEFWKNLSNGLETYFEGHPVPKIKINNSSALLDFTITEFDEFFQPNPPELIVEVNFQDLKNAVEKVEFELGEFATRLDKINRDENLGIQNIAQLLIWRNPNR